MSSDVPQLCNRFINAQYEVRLSHQYKLPRLAYKGGLIPTQTIRKRATPVIQEVAAADDPRQKGNDSNQSATRQQLHAEVAMAGLTGGMDIRDGAGSTKVASDADKRSKSVVTEVLHKSGTQATGDDAAGLSVSRVKRTAPSLPMSVQLQAKYDTNAENWTDIAEDCLDSQDAVALRLVANLDTVSGSGSDRAAGVTTCRLLPARLVQQEATPI